MSRKINTEARSHLRRRVRSAQNRPVTSAPPLHTAGQTDPSAQSTPPYSETSRVRVYPCSVRLYCGYSYESGLIAESFSTAITAAVMFAAGVSLLVFFVRSGKMERLCMALVAFLWMTIQVIDTSFFNNYFGDFTPNGITMCRFFAVLALLVFLIQKSRKYRKMLWTLVGLYIASLATYFIWLILAPNSIGALSRLLRGQLTEWIIMVSFAVILVLGMTVWKKESHFYRLFSPLSILGIAGYWVFMVLTNPQDVVMQFSVAVSELMISYFCYPTVPIVMGSALVVALIEAAQHEWKQRTEKRLLEERREMAQVTYESMCSQHEEVMKLRHDMVGHLETLRGIRDQAKITAYIDSLIGKNKRVRPIVHTGNEVLDIILNSKLSAAMEAGIKVEIPRSTAPAKLPIPDNDLSSIVINILNNAVTAASHSGAKEPFLKLDVHIKGSWLAIVCENSADIRQIEKKAKKETVPKHGLGLKIIEETAQQYGGLFDTEYGPDHYKVSVILPIG